MNYARRIRSRFGSHATTLQVKRAAPWYWRWVLLAASAVVFATAGVWLFRYGAEIGENRALATMGTMLDAKNRLLVAQSALAKSQQEIDALKASLVKANSEMQMSEASQADLIRALAQLKDRNIQLTEELAFLHKVTANDTTRAGLKLSDFAVVADGAPNAYRYRALLVLGGKPDREFQGNAELIVNVEPHPGHQNAPGTQAAPRKNIVQDIKFKYYQRLEGVFQVAAGATIKSVEIKIFEKGNSTPRITETAHL